MGATLHAVHVHALHKLTSSGQTSAPHQAPLPVEAARRAAEISAAALAYLTAHVPALLSKPSCLQHGMVACTRSACPATFDPGNSPHHVCSWTCCFDQMIAWLLALDQHSSNKTQTIRLTVRLGDCLTRQDLVQNLVTSKLFPPTSLHERPVWAFEWRLRQSGPAGIRESQHLSACHAEASVRKQSRTQRSLLCSTGFGSSHRCKVTGLQTPSSAGQTCWLHLDTNC